jgi:hypothetical protein
MPSGITLSRGKNLKLSDLKDVLVAPSQCRVEPHVIKRRAKDFPLMKVPMGNWSQFFLLTSLAPIDPVCRMSFRAEWKRMGTEDRSTVMEIIRREIYYSEPLHVILFSDRDLSDQELGVLDRVLSEWTEAKLRGEGGTFSYRPHIWRDLVRARTRREIRVSADWFPMEWFGPLSESLERRLPSLRRLEIGVDFIAPVGDERFIHVPAKQVRLHDDSLAQVDEFWIAKRPVTIERFNAFEEATGYVSAAERMEPTHNYRENSTLAMIPQHKRGTLPARFLCYLDAAAYCEWKGARLPSEAEWLAAWLIDDRVYEGEAAARRFEEISAMDDALADGGTELTATIVEVGAGKRVVVRQGPNYYREPRTRSNDAYNRLLKSLGYFEMVQFRVCRL